jgi:ABC-type Fe3+/spermidine/putrescine transport system ATPase subunit
MVKTALGEIGALLDERFAVGARCTLAIRPENAIVAGTRPADGNLLRGRITFAAYLGHTLRYDVELAPGIAFKIDMRDIWQHEQLPLGTEVDVAFAVASTVAIPAEP